MSTIEEASKARRHNCHILTNIPLDLLRSGETYKCETYGSSSDCENLDELD
jgi:hypothetical protein